MRKTQQKLLSRIETARKAGFSYVDVDGSRETQAARELVAAGKAVSFENHSGWTGGDYYIHPFTRRPATTKPRFHPAGRINL